MTAAPRVHVHGVEALTGREDAGVEHDDVDATETLDARRNRGRELVSVRSRRTGRRATQGQPQVYNVRVEIQTNDGGALLQQEFRAGATDAGRRPGNQRDLAGERWRRCLSEFGLLQIPVLDVEDVLGREGTVATEFCGVEDDFDGVPVDVGGD